MPEIARNTSGRSLELFFVDGKPDGMLTAEIFGWTGHVLMFPRTTVSAALKRPEANYTGVYVLLGERDGEPLIYIGEGDNVADRIRNHDTKRDWWTTAAVITTNNESLHKAHVRYLEARLIQVARDVHRANLENATTPPLPPLTEAARSSMESFLENVLMVLPALRIDYFLQKARPERPVADTPQAPRPVPIAVFELRTPRHGIEGEAALIDGEFVVRAGSKARKEWSGTPTHPYAALFEELVRSGVLREEGNFRVLESDYAFRSPSAAGAVLNGRATNGQEAWKVKGLNLSYRQWEQENLGSDGQSA